jgi:hypothetical protein
MTVTFRGALAANIRSFGLILGRSRRKSFGAWAEHANAVGFPAITPEMTLGVTERRVVVWRPSFWFGRPAQLIGTVPFHLLAQVEVYRSGLANALVFVFKTGELVEVEAMRAGGLRRIRDAVRERIEDW